MMPPVSGDGVSLAFAAAADSANPITDRTGGRAIESYERNMMVRGGKAANRAAGASNLIRSDKGVVSVLEHYRERVAS